MDLLYTSHVPAGDGLFPTVFALHGWGASAHDLLGLAPLFPGRALTLCPQGEVEMDVGPGMKGYGWFQLDPDRPPDEEAFRRASGKLATFVVEAADLLPVDPERTVVLGFSQGGVMAFDLTLRRPERFAGLIALSTTLPEILATDLPQLAAQRGFPVLLVHGRRDTMVPVDRAHKARDILEALGVDLTYLELDMAHEVSPEALRAIREWLTERGF
jgi:phospholipase/carboxylesterase